ncbi:VCBS domain-containing protein [Vibrio chagasii]|nr:VCBS domain-containing protein [Vibrio chagasii]
MSDDDAGEATFTARKTDTAGSYGTFNIGTDGVWTYRINDLDAVQELSRRGYVNGTFTVTSADGTEHDITVTINGTE